MNVPMEKQSTAPVSHRGRLVVVAMITLGVIIATLGIGYRRRHSSDAVSPGQTANADAAAPAAPVASPTPSASPSPSLSPSSQPTKKPTRETGGAFKV